MKEYLEKKSKQIDIISTLKNNFVRILILTVVIIAVIILFVVYDIEQDDANSIFAVLFFFLLIMISPGVEIIIKSKLVFKSEEILLLTIFTAFIKHLKIDKEKAFFIISDIFHTYNSKEIVRHFENIFSSE